MAQEIEPGSLVNLGIGLPSLVANYIPAEAGVFFQSENGVIGIGGRPPEGMEDPHLTDAGGEFITAVPGAASMDSAFSFGLIRDGHVDVTVLGALQVDESGRLANQKIPGAMVRCLGRAMDVAIGARKVIFAMIHEANGQSKLVRECSLPLTSERPVDLIVTEMAVLRPVESGLLVDEMSDGVTLDTLRSVTEARLVTGGS